MLYPIEANGLNGLPGIRHGFFTRAGGVSTGPYASLNCGAGSADDPAAVRENRFRVARHLGSPGRDVATLYQVHGATALLIDSLVPREALPKADAVVTKTRGLAIGVLTADCAPVLLADPAARIVAAVHAGWRGAVAGVIEAAILAMEALGAERRRVYAAIGPSIGQGAYEVGPEFEAELRARDATNGRFFRRASVNARPSFDLPAYVAHRLESAGAGMVDRATPCTYENESDFFSFRRAHHRDEADYGRQISAILLD